MRRQTGRIFRFCIVFVLSCSIAGGESAGLSPMLERLRGEGFNALYNMDYQAAKARFVEMTKTNPSHPAGYIYLASTIWLNYLFTLRRLQTAVYNRNDFFFTKNIHELDPKVDKEFRETMAKGIQLCESRIQANKDDTYALYYLGVAKGATAGYETTVKRSFFSSLRNGRAAVDLHKSVLKKDPTFTDAYLSVGMYEYVVGSLPLAVKILAFLGGVTGSKKDGLKTLEKVAETGHFARDEAAVILVLLYDREKRLDDSLKILNDLVVRYPRNSIFRLEQARTLARSHRLWESTRTFESLLDDSMAMDYMPDLIHYQYAETLLEAKAWEKAHLHYVAAASYAKAPESLITMARLGAGKCLDAMGRRQLAQTEYRIVLTRPEAFGSRELAQAYLTKPFSP